MAGHDRGPSLWSAGNQRFVVQRTQATRRAARRAGPPRRSPLDGDAKRRHEGLMTPSIDIESLRERLLRGDRAALARAITLAESKRPDHRALAASLIDSVLSETGKAIRVGITGVPGVGKSTTIDALGSNLTEAGHKVAVLAVDPSSSRTGGSILGDKTRMARLAHDPKAFIRPSPSSGTLGGVAAKTRETMLLCEAAGFDVILVETVGVGQSETAVADLTDFFLVLMLPGAGDELQGIKKGILELADMIAVNKADVGEAEQRANAAASEYRAALHILTPASATWTPPVVTISGFHNLRLDALWAKIVDHREKLTATGEIQAKRRAQDVKWMWALVHERLHQRLVGSPEVRRSTAEAEAGVARGETSPAAGAAAIAELIGL
ncbi:methylmalonyl-CoA mutase metallochaperone MeaB [Methylobacterium pseudosasicola]|uniref:Methylmalonyl-CoA mutase metallochaperone MeaB n=2 Tax=Methylobacterium pseudosasicola TaxID=582667 RepID=A0A1I4SWP9_9HYPH|nr:methylmalonyl-CoA mutase metallochaperone MeaB [Methylobacterium pseudosasicola]